MIPLYLSLLAMSPDSMQGYLAAKELRLELPSSFYSQISNQDIWLDNLYSISLVKEKTYHERSSIENNIYNTYLDDYYSDEDIQTLHHMTGKAPYTLTLHTRFWAGDSSGYAQGFSYSEKADHNLTWGMGVERAEIKSDKRYNWNNNSYYNVDSWLNWQPSPELNIFLGVNAYVPE
ncbi:hypothetical protein PQO03_06505 [Lentisphaera profundi]|uniref:Uncharacterized protein n=1 Tax=Lentisphaera profundi TaxID=1658616 RepID=A0ABY7VR82_9BACT|nr:hypothetical protein [Lentisphaera profundi]WDE95366.1 hypothetical protein PQO03_06505 [Lentisphaera profundi]